MNDIAKTDAQTIMEAVLTKGDLKLLTPAERNIFYDETCRSVGLNPLTRPFEYITLNGKLTLYARKDATEQLRKLHGISIKILERVIRDGLIIVHVQASDKSGRQDEDLGVVAASAGAQEVRANQMMKAITKAKRRVTLSICGLGFPDESEIEDIPEPKRGKNRVVTSADAPKQLPNPPEPIAAEPAGDSTPDEPQGLPAGLSQPAKMYAGELIAAARKGTPEFFRLWGKLHVRYKKELEPHLEYLKKMAGRWDDAKAGEIDPNIIYPGKDPTNLFPQED